MIEVKAVVFKIIAGQNAQQDNIVFELLYHVFVLQPFLNGPKTTRCAEIKHFFASGGFQQVRKPVFCRIAPAFNE